MSESNGNDLGAFLAGFVIGGLVGAAVALILAPQSGQEMRNQLMQRGDELRSRATEYRGSYQNRADQYVASTRERIQQAGTDVQERVRIVLDEGRARVENNQKPQDSDMSPDPTSKDKDTSNGEGREDAPSA